MATKLINENSLFMKKLLPILFIFSFLAFIQNGNAQCADFAKKEGLSVLDTSLYLHDGRFNAIKLKQGDDIYIYKAFYAQENYRIVVVSEKDLKGVTFEVTDFKKTEVIFSNTKNEKFFDFLPERSQRAIIHITIPSAEQGKSPEKGCVAILFGLKKES
jgi:hypothetical protein